MKKALIIFAKNTAYGSVKTRLAVSIGNDKALEIYRRLLQHTYLVTHQLNINKIVFYSDAVEKNDIWNDAYLKQVQQGNDLGKRMKNAFDYAFKNNYLNAVIIGTDCAELTENILIEAFEKLDKYDIVIGPAADGGYYLIGMKKLYKQLFKNIEWSTSAVLKTTISLCNQNELSFYQLPLLHDVDEEKDLQYLKAIE